MELKLACHHNYIIDLTRIYYLSDLSIYVHNLDCTACSVYMEFYYQSPFHLLFWLRSYICCTFYLFWNILIFIKGVKSFLLAARVYINMLLDQG